MPPALVPTSNIFQATADSSATTTISFSSAGSSSAGDLIAVWISTYSAAAVTYTVTDQGGGNAFTQGTDFAWDTVRGVKSAVWYLPSCPAGVTGVRVTPSGSARMSLVLAEFSGVSGAVDGTPSLAAAATAGTAASSGNTTPAADGDLVLGLCNDSSYVNGSGFPTYTAGGGYTGVQFGTAASNRMGIAAEYQVQALHAALAGTFTLSVSNRWWAHVIAFQAAAVASVGGPFPHYTRRRLSGGMITMGG